MSFIGNLAKGFVRSAVNQVGRDGGKVISNKLYKDAHATPIRNVGKLNGSYYDLQTEQELTLEQLQEKVNNEGYKKTYFTSGLFLKTFLYCCGLFFTISLYIVDYWYLFPPIILCFTALLKFLSRNNVSVYSWQDVPVYKQDGRTRSGRKFVGYSREKVTYNIPSTEKDKKIYLYIFILYILLAILMALMGKYCGEKFLEHEKNKINIEQTEITNKL